MVQRELSNRRVSLEDRRYGENSFYADRLDLALLSVFILLPDIWKERLFFCIGCFTLWDGDDHDIGFLKHLLIAEHKHLARLGLIGCDAIQDGSGHNDKSS